MTEEERIEEELKALKSTNEKIILPHLENLKLSGLFELEDSGITC